MAGGVAGPGGEDAGFLGGGLLLIEPNRTIFDGIQEYSSTLALDWWAHGVSRLIHNYFKYVVNMPVLLLAPLEASASQCLGEADGLSYEEEGSWNMPAFVHSSSSRSPCFDYNWSAQLVAAGGSVTNVCHFHPLGAWWRRLFCSGINATDLNDASTAEFCDDAHWYNISAARR